MLEPALSKALDRADHLVGAARNHVMTLAQRSDVRLDRLSSDVCRTEAGERDSSAPTHRANLRRSFFQLFLRDSPRQPSVCHPGDSPERRIGHPAYPDRWPAPPSGLRFEQHLAKVGIPPENEIGPASLHRSRRTLIPSSKKRPRSAHATPTASSSSRIHPVPTPRITLPPDRASRVATSLAKTIGFRVGVARTVVPIATVLVIELTKASVMRAS